MKFDRARLGKALFHARDEQDLTQEETAELIGVTLRWYQMLEHGDASPSVEILCKLIGVFHLEIEDFAKEEEKST